MTKKEKRILEWFLKKYKIKKDSINERDNTITLFKNKNRDTYSLDTVVRKATKLYRARR